MHVGTTKEVKKVAWVVGGVALLGFVLTILVVYLARSVGDVPTAGLGLTVRVFLLGVLLVGFSFVPKLPGRRFLAGLGVFLFLIGIFGLFFSPEIRANQDRKAKRIAAAQAEPPVQEFTIKASEEVDTVETGPGTRHRYSADSNWVLLSAVPEGVECPQRRSDGLCEFPMNPRGRIDGTSAAGPARVMGVAPIMTIRFEKIR